MACVQLLLRKIRWYTVQKHPDSSNLPNNQLKSIISTVGNAIGFKNETFQYFIQRCCCCSWCCRCLPFCICWRWMLTAFFLGPAGIKQHQLHPQCVPAAAARRAVFTRPEPEQSREHGASSSSGSSRAPLTHTHTRLLTTRLNGCMYCCTVKDNC